MLVISTLHRLIEKYQHLVLGIRQDAENGFLSFWLRLKLGKTFYQDDLDRWLLNPPLI